MKAGRCSSGRVPLLPEPEAALEDGKLGGGGSWGRRRWYMSEGLGAATP